MILDQAIVHDKELPLPVYAKALPPLCELIAEYRVHPAFAWGLWRPVVVALEPAMAADLLQVCGVACVRCGRL
jgi:hypothetical protein